MHQKPEYTFHQVYFITIVLILIAVTLFIKKGDEVIWINGLHNTWLDQYFTRITHFGNAAYFIPVLLALLFVRYSYALSMVIAGISHGLVLLLMKRVLFPEAGRPIQYLPLDQLHPVPGVDIHSHMSFPSGHTATAFAFMVILSLCLKHRLLSVFLSLIALSVGISRIYLLQHFGWDVAIGAMIGTLCAWISYKVIHGPAVHAVLNGRLKLRLKLGNRLQVKLSNEPLNLPE
jgi:membrane-associated phospholipid phosphatase